MLDARHRRWVIVLTAVGSFMAALDTLVVASTAIPTIRARPGRVPDRPRVDGQRLQPQPRGAARAGRGARRPARAGPHATPAGWPVRARLGRLRARPAASTRWSRCGPSQGAGAAAAADARAGAADRGVPGGTPRCGGRPATARSPASRSPAARSSAGWSSTGSTGSGSSGSTCRSACSPYRSCCGSCRRSGCPTARSTSPAWCCSPPACFALVWALVRSAPVGWDAAPRCSGAGRQGSRCSARFVGLGAPCAAPAACRRRAAAPGAGFTAGNVAAFLTLASLFSAVFFYGQLLQVVLGESPLEAGLRLMAWTGHLHRGRARWRVRWPTGSASGRCSPPGWRSRRPRCCGSPRPSAPTCGYLDVLGPFVVGGVGVSMAVPCGQSAVVAAVEDRDVGDRVRRQRHDARARRRVRDRGDRGGLRGVRRLRVAGGVRRRLRPGDHRPLRRSPRPARWPVWPCPPGVGRSPVPAVAVAS